LAAPAAQQPLRSLEMRDVEHPAFERYGTAVDHGREVLEQRSGFALGQHRIFQISHRRVGRRAGRSRQLALRVDRNEKKRSHDGFIYIECKHIVW
jgi:hypothetical protein